ncbi:MAG: phosphoglucomutase/phosphomannomutase family protein [Pyrinomonadaceae bacterium]
MTSPLPQIKFGTDGWRAIIAREFTFANVERVAQAYAEFLKSQPSEQKRSVVIGYDRRFLSERFAERAAEIMIGNGFGVAMFKEAQPTPLISWSVKDLSATGGIVITASHNPATFNGFKIKAPWGGSATPETTALVEQLVDRTRPVRGEMLEDGHELLEPSIARYRQQIASCVDLEKIRATSGAVIVDPMHGSAGTWVESFLNGGALQIQTIRAFRDPLFGGVNPEPIRQNLEALTRRVVETGAIAGVATDGDADRIGAVDELGKTMTMHDVVPLLLLHLSRRRKMAGAVVVTVSQSVLSKRIAAAEGLKIYETPIGFKHVAELMLKEDILLGAEESGGIGVKGHIPERDGVLNSLLFLEALVASGKRPSEIIREIHREFGEFYFGRRDVHMAVTRGQELVDELKETPPAKFAGQDIRDMQILDGVKFVFADDSWVLLRQSGTEAMLRVYAEAISIPAMNLLLDAGQELTR